MGIIFPPPVEIGLSDLTNIGPPVPASLGILDRFELSTGGHQAVIWQFSGGFQIDFLAALLTSPKCMMDRKSGYLRQAC